jgi:hypothetical protein
VSVATVRHRAELDADLEQALVDWRQFRRKKRIADVHWIDVFYRAYVAAILGLIAVVFLSGVIGDDEVDAAGVREVLQHGPAWLGGIAAAAIALGLRSGSRGGPLALERAEVRHVLLAPVDRSSALRGPAIRQLRFLAFVGAVVGGVAGQLASHRLPEAAITWVAVGALSGLTAVGLAVGTAYVTGGLRVPRWLASLLGVALVVVAVLHGAGTIGFSPTEPFGRLLLWPLHVDALGLVFVVLALVLVVLGLSMVGAASLEAAERRSTLVGQLRFAATLQDLRTVVVLRRQLALELPRRRPWIRLRVRGTGRLPIFVRGLRGVLRWPAARVARLGLLAVVAAAALRGAWTGTTPLIVVPGLAMFLAGLDAIEPLAQEVDHPSRRDSSPYDAAHIHVRHIPVGVVVLVLTGALAAGHTAIPGPGQIPGEIALALAVPLALGGLGGALINLLGGPAGYSEAWTLAPPEAQGMRLAFRTAWPLVVAVSGAAPILAARIAVDDGNPGAPAALAAAAGVLGLFLFVCAWVRVRDAIAAWWKVQMQQAFPQRSETDG